MRTTYLSVGLAVAVASVSHVVAQSPSPVEFDVVSIKLSTSGPDGGMRIEPDGTLLMTNQPLVALLGNASPVPVLLRNVVGYPDWVTTERYDVTVKPPAGLSREELSQTNRQRWKAMFADRMKLAGHIEQREQDVFDLVLARGDRRLGPELKPSTLDCTARGTPPRLSAAPAPPPASVAEARNRCGAMSTSGTLVSGGMTMDQLAVNLNGRAGGQVTNKTDLQGPYALSLKFSQRPLSADRAPDDDAPDIFTALQEQLGLKLVRSKAQVPVFVIDHLERPTPN